MKKQRNKKTFVLSLAFVLILSLVGQLSLIAAEEESMNYRLQDAKKIDDDGIIVNTNSSEGKSYNERLFPENEVFFKGEGYILLEDESTGNFLDIKILNKNNILSGKVILDGVNYNLEGKLSNQKNIEFSINSIGKEESKGEFSGKIINLDNLRILKGEISFTRVIEGDQIIIKDFDLTAFSKKSRLLYAESKESYITNLGDYIVLQEEKETSEVGNTLSESATSDNSAISSPETYIRPIEVEKQKILGFIPNPWGKNSVRLEVKNEKESKTYSLSEGSSKEINGYNIKVESIIGEEVDLSIN